MESSTAMAEFEHATQPVNILGVIDKQIGILVGVMAAILIIAEVVVLGTGVYFRYVLDQPLHWTDELAEILFSWLSMCGAVIALHRRQHMRLAFLTRYLPQRWAELNNVLVWSILAVILGFMLPAAVEYAMHSARELTPALQISLSYRVSAIAFGMGAMLITALNRMLQAGSLPRIAAALAVIGVLALGMWLAKPVFQAMGNYNLIFFFVVLVLACIGLGVEIAFAFGIASLAYLQIIAEAPATIIMNRLGAAVADIVLLSIPMFIFVGVLLEVTGLARALINLMIALLGHVRGGLHYVLLAAMYLVSGISGSKSADMAAIAPILLPEMKKRGAREGELVALLSVSGAAAETIPPSIILIAVGVASGVSISSLFIGGLLPALIGMLMLAAVVYFRHRHQEMSSVKRAARGEVAKAFIIALPALILPILIRTAVVEGVATATEVATIGVVYSVLCGLFVYRQFPLKKIYEAMQATASLTGAIMLVTGLAGGMAWSLTQSGFSDDLVSLMQSVPGGAVTFLLVSIVFFTVLGSVLEGFPAIVLFAPLMFPIALQFGIHGVHYAMVVVLSMSIGLFAPPFGVGFYSACAIARVAPDQAMRDIWIYMAAFIALVVLVALVPWISIGFLPA